MKRLTKIMLVIFLLWTMVCGLWSKWGTSLAEASVPHLINYQGRLTDTSNKPLEGAYDLTFRLFDAETAGSLLWEETHTGVVISKGIFSIMLGSVTNLDLPFDKQYYLEIKVGTEVMSPRQRITSSGYAIRAEEAENAIQAQNADAVGNVGVSTTPAANKLVPLDSNAKLPLSALKVYDSGWFAVITNTSYTKTHNLTTTKVLVSIYLSDTSSGGDNCLLIAAGDNYDGSNQSGINTYSISTTSISIRTAPNFLYRAINGSGTTITPTSGYARIIMLALE